MSEQKPQTGPPCFVLRPDWDEKDLAELREAWKKYPGALVAAPSVRAQRRSALRQRLSLLIYLGGIPLACFGQWMLTALAFAIAWALLWRDR